MSWHQSSWQTNSGGWQDKSGGWQDKSAGWQDKSGGWSSGQWQSQAHSGGQKQSKAERKTKDNKRKKGGRSSQQRADGRGKLKLALQTAQWHLNLAQGQVVTLQAGGNLCGLERKLKSFQADRARLNQLVSEKDAEIDNRQAGLQLSCLVVAAFT